MGYLQNYKNGEIYKLPNGKYQFRRHGSVKGDFDSISDLIREVNLGPKHKKRPKRKIQKKEILAVETVSEITSD